MSDIVLLAFFSAATAVLSVPFCQAVARRHTLGSRRALNVEGRIYDTADGQRPPEPEDAAVPHFKSQIGLFRAWVSSRFSADARASYEADVATDEKIYADIMARAVGTAWWEGKPLLSLIADRRGETGWLAAVAALMAAVPMWASPFLNGLAGGWAWVYAGLWGIVTACLVVNAVTDWRHYVLPHRINLFLLLGTLGMAFARPLGLAAAGVNDPGGYLIPLGIGLFLYLLFLAMEATGRSGGGDTRIVISFGFLLGGWVLFTLMYSSVLAVVYKLTIARWAEARKVTPDSEDSDAPKKSFLKQKVPYGPFLVLGLYAFLLTFHWNALFFQWYFTAFVGR